MRFLSPALLAALLAGCGGDTGGQPVAPPTTPPPPPEPTPPEPEIDPDDLVAPPAEAGKVAEEGLELSGLPPGTAYEWTTDENSGWVFPAQGRTDAQGRLTGTWIPGFPGVGKLVLTLSEAGEERMIEYQTLSVWPARPPWFALALQIVNEEATGYSIDMTPLVKIGKTFYAAVVWSTGYIGFQRGGSQFNDQLQFSLWDRDGVDADVVAAGERAFCTTFGHEGHGSQCRVDYSWEVDRPYRFRLEMEDTEDGRELVSAWVTDIAAGEERFIGTLRGKPHIRRYTSAFVEDFARQGNTCLHQNIRAAAFRRARARRPGEGWVPVTRAYLNPNETDSANPGTPGCANWDARPHPAGLELIIGGTTIRDPAAPREVRIPE